MRQIADLCDKTPAYLFAIVILLNMGLRANSFLAQLAVHKSGQLLGTTSDQVKSHPLFARTLFNPILTKWRRDLSLVLALENANCVTKGRRNTLGRYRGGTMPDAAHGVENEWSTTLWASMTGRAGIRRALPTLRRFGLGSGAPPRPPTHTAARVRLRRQLVSCFAWPPHSPRGSILLSC